MLLSALRKHSRSTIIYVLFGVIIAAFILTFNTMGPTKGCGGGDSAEVMAKVGGAKIDTGVLSMASFFTIDPPDPTRFNEQSIQLQQMYENTRFLRANPDLGLLRFMPYPEELSSLKMRRVMDDIVETWLVSEKALELGLGVSDEELAERIYQNPQLKGYWYDDDGKFQKRAFFNFVQYSLRTTAARFEDFVRREMLREKLVRYLAEQVQVADAEVDFEWRLANEKVDLAFVELDPARVRSVLSVTDAEVAKAKTDRKDAIETYYKEHKGQFEKEERAQVHGIFFKAPLLSRIERTEKPEDKAKLVAERDAARKKADEVLAELNKPVAAPTPVEPPAPAPAPPAPVDPAVAPAAPVDPAAAPADPAAAPVDPAAAPAAPADPAAAAEVAPAPTPAPAPAPVEKGVSVERFEALAKEKTEDEMTKETGGAFADLKPRSAFSIWPFGKDVPDALFRLAPGEVTGVLEVPNGYWILRLDEKVAAEKRTVDEARDEIARILLQEERAAEQTKALADELLAKAKAANGDLEKAVADWLAAHPSTTADADAAPVLEVRETGPFALAPAFPGAPWGSIPLVGAQQDLARAAFALTTESPLASQVFEVKRGDKTHYVVARLEERIAADDTNATEEKDAIRERLVRDKQRTHYRAWYQNLRREAEKAGDIEETAAFKDIVQAEQTQREEALKRMLERQSQGGGAPIPMPAPAM